MEYHSNLIDCFLVVGLSSLRSCYEPVSTGTQMKPFLKWAGGKYRQLPQIQPFLVGNRLIEPFVGAGSEIGRAHV